MISSDKFRRVLSHYATGVTIVTAVTESGPVGMTCNSVTAVSLDPPLILLCPARTSDTWPLIAQAGQFVVNVMARDQETLVRQFARKDADRFAGVATHDREHGVGLDGAVAWIECVTEHEHEAGDHTIAVAKVLRLDAHLERDPLVFFRGKYGSFHHGEITTTSPAPTSRK